MATQTVTAGIEEIPISQIAFSKTNPRKAIDPDAINSLAASIEAQGLLEPIVVRPIGKPTKDSGMRYEVVVGERRLRAHQHLKRETIPAVVRELDDEHAMEAQIIENLQREDLHPLEEADGMKKLLKGGENIQRVADALGKDLRYVTRALKLLDLIEPAKKAYLNGTILTGHAMELSRLRAEEQQAAMKFLIEDKQVNTRAGYVNVGPTPKSVPELRAFIQGNLMLDLRKAPFDTTDATLSELGACTTCPYRTGSKPDLFGDIKSGDICTFPADYGKKMRAALDRRVEALVKEHGVKKLIRIQVGDGYANRPGGELSIPYDVSVGTWNAPATLVKKGDECDDTKLGVVVNIDRNIEGGKVGDVHPICVNRECKKHKARSHSMSSSTTRQAKSFAERAKTQIENLRKSEKQRARNAVMCALIAAAEKRSFAKPDRPMAQVFATELHSRMFSDRDRDLCKALGMEPIMSKRYGSEGKDWHATFDKRFKDNPVATMVAAVCGNHWQSGYSDSGADPVMQLAKIFKVDTAKIGRAVHAEVETKVKAIQEAVERSKAKLKVQAKNEVATSAAKGKNKAAKGSNSTSKPTPTKAQAAKAAKSR